MQSGNNPGNLWRDIAGEVLSLQGILYDYTLESLKADKKLDFQISPVQTINYYFAQAVILTLKSRVGSCRSVEELTAQLDMLISEAGMKELVDQFVASESIQDKIKASEKTKHPITEEYIRKQIKLDAVISHLRLFYQLEKIALAAGKLSYLESERMLFTAEEFVDAVKSQSRQCKDALAHLTSEMLIDQQLKKVDPVVELNNHLVRQLENKKVCQLVVRDLMLLPPEVSVEKEYSYVQKFPQFAQLTSLDDIGVMMSHMANKKPAGAGWEAAKTSYAEAIRVLESEIKANVLTQNKADLKAYQDALAGMSKLKDDISGNIALDTFGDHLMQFDRVTAESAWGKLTDELIANCKSAARDDTTMSRLSAKLNQAVDDLASKLPGKHANLKEMQKNPVTERLDRLVAAIDTAKKPYDDGIARFEILTKLRQSQNQLGEAEELQRHWQTAAEQLEYITDAAIRQCRDISGRLQDVEKEQPNMVADFIKRRWPEMSISFGSVGVAGGGGITLLSIFASVTFPVTLTVAAVAVVSVATAVGVGIIKDLVTQPKTEKEIALETLGALTQGEVQRVEQPPAAPPQSGIFARFFGDASTVSTSVVPAPKVGNNNNLT